ncbi:MAG: hypothetical protein ACRC33_23915, partial [Gemmataceae bacterium]
MSTWLTRFGAVCVLALALGSARADDLEDVKTRLKIEAQRVEREFAADRAAAYRLVREDGARLREATEKLQGLLSMVRNDTSLERVRRELLVVTLKADLERVRDIAAVRQPAATRPVVAAPGRPPVSGGPALPRAADTGKGRVDDLTAMLDRRRGAVTEKTVARLDKTERFSRSMAGVEESAVPESADATFPKNWEELSKKRSSEVKMTDMERAIVKSLSTPIAVEYAGDKFQDVLDHLRKVTGLPIT